MFGGIKLFVFRKSDDKYQLEDCLYIRIIIRLFYKLNGLNIILLDKIKINNICDLENNLVLYFIVKKFGEKKI